MPLPGGDIEVKSGSGKINPAKGGGYKPLVMLSVAEMDGPTATLYLSPERARMVAADLMSSAANAAVDTAIRVLGDQDPRLDPDRLIEAVQHWAPPPPDDA